MASLTAPTAPRPVRAVALYTVVMTALVLAWFAAAWQRHEWRSSNEPLDAIAYFVPPTMFLVIALITRWRLQTRERPAGFEIRDGAFVAPAARHLSAANSVVTLSWAAGLTASHLWPDQDESSFTVAVWRIILAITVITFLATIMLLGRGTGRITLRPEGLRITYPHGSRDVPWDAVLTALPQTGRHSEPKLPVERPELLRSTGLVVRRPPVVYLPVDTTWIQREFLVGAVNHYIADSAARPAIGGFEAQEHLRRALRAG